MGRFVFICTSGADYGVAAIELGGSNSPLEWDAVCQGYFLLLYYDKLKKAKMQSILIFVS